ncbi:hypothetical protein PMAC_001358 [Pneumocystis sp. 'macacae']|nr:hypothetical protein PMAC_001358 [Pneumocystis sp. 'macacae']
MGFILMFIEIPFLMRICPTSRKFDSFIQYFNQNWPRAGVYIIFSTILFLSGIIKWTSLIVAAFFMIITCLCYVIAALKGQTFANSSLLGGSVLLEVTKNQIQFHRLKLHSEVFSEKERSVLLLLEKLEELNNEKKMIILDEKVVVDNTTLEKDLSEKIKEAQFELLIANAINTTKNLIIENFIETNPILQAVYFNGSLTEQDRAINSSLEKCDNIISKLLKFHNFLLKNEKKILYLQKKILKSFSENEEKVKKILEITANIRDREEKMLSVFEKQQKEKLVKEMNDIKHRVAIVKNCLQGIILESGINWFENEHWRNIMLKTGEHDNYIIK